MQLKNVSSCIEMSILKKDIGSELSEYCIVHGEDSKLHFTLYINETYDK